RVISRVGLDDVGAQLHGLADQGQDFVGISVDHVAAGFLIRLKNERLDHERHCVSVALRFEAQDILQALIGHLGLFGNAEQVDDHADGVEAQSLCRIPEQPEVADQRSEEHTSELQSRSELVCRLLLEKKKT